jgi:hypothetical protein
VSAQLEHIESSTALAPAMRAAIALDSARHRKELADLVKKSAGIVAVLNGDARDEAHRAGMVLKNARVNIQRRGKEAREDATAFGKAVIAEEKTLVDLILPEEARVLRLRDEWDAQVEAERQAKVAAERARVDRLQYRIAEIRTLPALMTGKSAEEIGCEIYRLATNIPGASFEEFEEQAKAARLEALDKLAKMETEQRGVEIRQESARQEAERQRLDQEAEAARLKAEREELARLRAEQQAQLAAERAEAERIRKLEDEARAFKLQQEREELERQNAAMRLERAKLAEQQAAIDASRRAAEEAEAERVRLQAAADQALEDARKPAPVNPNEPAAIIARPADEDIVQVIADHFGVPVDQAYGWLIELSHELEYH